ncbi:MAG: putative acetyltransferase [Arenicella sp.]
MKIELELFRLPNKITISKTPTDLIEYLRTTSKNVDFIALIKQLDAYLAITDGDEHDFYNQFNKLDKIKYVLIGYDNGKAVACGAIRKFDSETMEVKRMFVSPENRGKGIAKSVLAELESWTKELGLKKCVLETGTRQIEAVALYKSADYDIIPSYGQYLNVENSICFGKELV